MPRGGKREGAGRKFGSIGTRSVAVKQCLINAFEEIGGWQNLAKWATENQTEFYKIWSKMIPQDVQPLNKDGEASDGFIFKIERYDVK